MITDELKNSSSRFDPHQYRDLILNIPESYYETPAFRCAAVGVTVPNNELH